MDAILSQYLEPSFLDGLYQVLLAIPAGLLLSIVVWLVGWFIAWFVSLVKKA